MTAKGEFRHDMHKDPAQLERDADRARANVESTLEAIERRLSPGELLDQVLHVVKDNGGEFGRNLATQVRNNPVPVLLTGIGMAWLITASDRPPRSAATSTGHGHAGSSVGDRMSSAASSARSAAGRAGAGARAAADSARAAAGSVSDAAQGMKSTARDALHGVADGTRAGVRGARDGYDYLRREQPLALGALALAAGALIGAILPSTEAEDRVIGPYSDDAAERLEDEGRRQTAHAKSVAADAAESAREAMEPTHSSRTDSGNAAAPSARS